MPNPSLESRRAGRLIGDVATGSGRDLPLEDGNGPVESDDALAALVRDNPAAFAALYIRYVDLVYRFCYRRLGDRAAAEDATSRIFERALRALPRYRAGSFRSWLFTIAYNILADLHRAERKAHRIPPEWDAPDSKPGPEAQAVDADEARWIRGLLPHLTQDQRHRLAHSRPWCDRSQMPTDQPLMPAITTHGGRGTIPVACCECANRTTRVQPTLMREPCRPSPKPPSHGPFFAVIEIPKVFQPLNR